MSDDARLLTVLQLSNSAFPIGSFSHSLGFEAALSNGLVTTAEKSKNFVTACLENAGSQGVPFVVAGYVNHDNLEVLIKLDKICSACLSNHVAKRASTRQGCSLAVAAAKVFVETPVLPQLMAAVDEDKTMEGHFAVMFGAVCGALTLGLHSTVMMYLFGSLQTVIASAVRLGHIGPMEAQRLQFVCQGLIPAIAKWSSKMSTDDVHIRWPLVDTVQNCHDTMFSKLFYS